MERQEHRVTICNYEIGICGVILRCMGFDNDLQMGVRRRKESTRASDCFRRYDPESRPQAEPRSTGQRVRSLGNGE